MHICTKITEVNLSVFVYRLFHEDFSLHGNTKFVFCILLYSDGFFYQSMHVFDNSNTFTPKFDTVSEIIEMQDHSDMIMSQILTLTMLDMTIDAQWEGRGM